MEQSKTFADGLIVKKPREGAPDFVMGRLSFKVDEFVAFLSKHKDTQGWVNVDLLIGQSGKPYAALDTWKPEKPATKEKPEVVTGEEIPF